MVRQEEDYEEEDSDEEQQGGDLDVSAESIIELQKFIIDPDARKKFNYLIKDLSLSNLNETDMEIVRRSLFFLQRIINIFTELEEDKKIDAMKYASVRQVLSMVYVVVSSARARQGFERKMIATQRMERFNVDTQQKKGRKWWGRSG